MLKMTQSNKSGYLYAIAAFVFWGFIPIYFAQFENVNPWEVLIHRIIWSVVVLIFLLQITKQYKQLKPIFKDFSQLKYLFISSVFISANWVLFIYAVGINKILETSLGYFINPLISVLFGYIFFTERLTKIQTFAIALALIAIILELINIGSLPLISLGLAFSFGMYGMVRKKVKIASIPGLFVETLLLLPFAIAYMIYLFYTQTNAFYQGDTYLTFMFSLGGIITVLPLLWFNAGVTRINLSTVGMLQYIGPTISFLVALYIYNEPLDENKLLTFVLIWIALVIFTYEIFKNKKN